MAQRIMEGGFSGLSEDGAGGFVVTGQIYFVDTAREENDRVFLRYVNVLVSPSMTMAQFQAARSQAYRDAITAEFGSAPSTCILHNLVLL